MSSQKHINKSFSANSIFHKASFSQGDEYFFKISPTKVPNTEGECPVIVYKKERKIPTFFDIGLRDSGYITDGGLKKRQRKFEGSASFCKQSHKIFSTSLKQRSTFSNCSSAMKGKYSQSMRNINPKKSQDIKLHSKPSTKLKTSNIIMENNATLSQKGNANANNMNTSSVRPLISQPQQLQQQQQQQQRQCLSPEMKNEQIEGLIGKGIALKIKDIQNERIKKTREDEIKEKKQRYLKDNGITYEDMNNEEEEGEFEGEGDDNEEGEGQQYERESKMNASEGDGVGIEKSKGMEDDKKKDNNNQQQHSEPKKMSKTNRTFSNSVFCSSNHKEAMMESNSIRAMIKSNSNCSNNIYTNNDSKVKKILKPKINQFEYLHQINNEMKLRSRELHTSESPSHRNHNHKEQNSFRKSHSSNHNLKSNSDTHNSNTNNNSNNNQIIQIDSKKQQVYDDEHNFLFSYQANHRSEEELANFILSKRLQNQEREQKENLESNQKTFAIFRNLYILSQRLQTKQSKPRTKRIMNEFYIGTQSNHNISTVIDPNEYYYSVLEGQKLIVKTHFDSEQSQLDKSSNNSQRKCSTNNNNISREEIRKITKQIADESEKKANNNGNSNVYGNGNSNMSSGQFTELKNKVIQTILRANKLLSKENLDQIFESKHSQNTNENNNTNSNQQRQYSEKNQLNELSQENDKRSNSLNNNNRKGDKISSNTHSTQQIVSIENSSSNNGTKNLPSLSHTYTNNNTSSNKKNMIEPRAILNLVEIIKILTQRKVFYMLYEDYFNDKMIQRYTIAFVYFNAILKQRTFHSIEAYAHYKTYYYGCSQLFLPFKRKQFEYFVSNCYFKKKVQYLTELLNHITKKKVIERIYVYGRACYCDEEIAFYTIFMKIMQITMRPKLQEAFRLFVSKASTAFTALKKSVDKVKEPELKPNKSSALKDMKFEDSKSDPNDTNSQMSDFDMYEKRVYTYDSCSEQSDFTIEPNSLDSDKLHRVIMMNLKQKELMANLGYSKEEIEEHDNLFIAKHHKKNKRKGGNNNNHSHHSNSRHSHSHSNKDNDNQSKNHSLSNKSVKSLKDICEMKPGIKSNKSIDELQKSLSNHSLKESLEEKLNYLKKSPSRNSSLNKSKESNKEEEEKNSQDRVISGKENDKRKSNELLIENLAPLINKDKQSSSKEKSIEIKVSIVEEGGNEKRLSETIKKKDTSNQITSEQDVSADKDCKENIDWELNLSNLKGMGNDNKKEESGSNTPITAEKIDLINKDKDKGEEVFESIPVVILNKEEEQVINKEIIIETAIKPKESKSPEVIEKDKDCQKQNTPNLFIKEEGLPSPINKPISQQGKASSMQKSPKLTDSYYNEFEEENNLKCLEDNVNNTEENIVNIIQSEVSKDLNQPIQPTHHLSLPQIDSIVNDILTELLQSEIKSQDQRIVPYKSFKMPIQVNTSSSFPPVSNDSPNSSIFLNITYISHFNKTIKDKKKEQSLNLYKAKVFPKLLEHIMNEIIANYPKIYQNLKTSIRSNPIGLMKSLALEDAEMLRENYKRLPLKPNELELLNREKILTEFEVINKKIRTKDNVIGDNYYDNMLNGGVVDTAIELLQKERLYGDMGEPLPWSSRTRELKYKYPKDDPTRLANYIEEQLIGLIDIKIGLITDNYDNTEPDQLNMEREKRLIRNIVNELNEADVQWVNLEMEETQTKIEVNKLLMDQLYNEVIEILEHIQYSRKCPELYQSKSIYACEEIPKLTFQMTSSENEDDEENDLINI